MDAKLHASDIVDCPVCLCNYTIEGEACPLCKGAGMLDHIDALEYFSRVYADGEETVYGRDGRECGTIRRPEGAVSWVLYDKQGREVGTAPCIADALDALREVRQ